MTNYGREMRMGANIRREGKVKKITEFVERVKKKKLRNGKREIK